MLGLMVEDLFVVLPFRDAIEGPKMASAFLTSVLVIVQFRIPASIMSIIAADGV